MRTEGERASRMASAGGLTALSFVCTIGLRFLPRAVALAPPTVPEGTSAEPPPAEGWSASSDGAILTAVQSLDGDEAGR